MDLITNIISEIERRGVDTEGIYRINGVLTRVDQLISTSLNPATSQSVDLSDESSIDFNTLTSSLKYCFRNMSEPVCTFALHQKFIQAAKMTDSKMRLETIMSLVNKLPETNRKALCKLSNHLSKVVQNRDLNKMNLMNLGVCFGPTLLRDKEESVQSIMEIKFSNTVVEVLIENSSLIFETDDETVKSQNVFPSSISGFVRLPSQRTKLRRARRDWDRLEDFRKFDCTSTSPPLSQLSPSDEEIFQPRFQRSKAFRSHEKREVMTSRHPHVDEDYEEDEDGESPVRATRCFP